MEPKRVVLGMTTERELQTYLVDSLRKNGFWVVSTSRRSKNVTAGIPDVICYDLLNKQAYLLEVKGPKTPLSEEQERAVRLGAIRIIRDKETADKFIRREAC